MKYIDLHCDTLSALYHRKVEKITEDQEIYEGASLISSPLCVDLTKMKTGDALLQAFACFVYLKGYNTVDDAWDYVMRLLDFYEKESTGTGLKLCLSGNDLDDQMHSLLTVEEGGILNGIEERLDTLYERGIRLITLTWNFENCLGFPNSPNAEIMNRGLKPFGKTIVEKMNALKMLADVSHLSDGGFYDVADIMKSAGRPFVASHSCARVLCNHPRNLTDEMLKVLGNQGGIVGANFYGVFLNKENRSDIASIVEHLKYIVNKAGIEAAALGSDFDGFDGGCEINDVSQMPKLFDALKVAGFTASEIEKIAWKNAARLIKTSI